VVVSGGIRIAFGTFTNGSGDSGGTIGTGLKFCNTFVYSASSHLGGEQVKVTKNSGTPGNVAIVTSDSIDGDWVAFGL
jgi:hypothetical protein